MTCIICLASLSQWHLNDVKERLASKLMVCSGRWFLEKHIHADSSLNYPQLDWQKKISSWSLELPSTFRSDVFLSALHMNLAANSIPVTCFKNVEEMIDENCRRQPQTRILCAWNCWSGTIMKRLIRTIMKWLISIGNKWWEIVFSGKWGKSQANLWWPLLQMVE